jgi:hypothetical protein
MKCEVKHEIYIEHTYIHAIHTRQGWVNINTTPIFFSTHHTNSLSRFAFSAVQAKKDETRNNLIKFYNIRENEAKGCGKGRACTCSYRS